MVNAQADAREIKSLLHPIWYTLNEMKPEISTGHHTFMYQAASAAFLMPEILTNCNDMPQKKMGPSPVLSIARALRAAQFHQL